MRTSINVDERTLEIIKILNVPFQKIFDRGLVSMGIEGKVKDPQVAAAILRLQRDKLEALDFEIRRLKELQDKFDRIRENEEDSVQETEEAGRDEQKPIRRPEDFVGYEPGVLPEQLVDMILNNRNIALRQLHTIVTAYLSDVIGNYNDGAIAVIQDLNNVEFSGQGEHIWATLKQRDDLDELIETILSEVRGE